MARLWIERIIYLVVFLFIVIAGFGQAVLQLWNWLVPELFGLPVLTFWQAVGLLGLCWLLFGGMRGLGLVGGWPERRPATLSESEREAFRAASETSRAQE